MKTNKTIVTLIVVVLTLPVGIAAQTISGQSSNLCPGYTPGYIYNSETGCGGTDGADWVVVGGKIISNGNTPTLGDYIAVQWFNVTQGTVHNDCGTLNVAVNGIAQPTISPSNQTLCGSGSITLHASVSSTTNISGYIWSVIGTGVTPTGSYTTSGPGSYSTSSPVLFDMFRRACRTTDKKRFAICYPKECLHSLVKTSTHW